jgi:DNA polymerase V
MMPNIPRTEIREFEGTTGFESPAQDYIEGKLDLNARYIRHPAATFFMRVDSDAMTGAGIYRGDVIIVDRALDAKSGKIVVAVAGGELVVRRLHIADGETSLMPENSNYEPIPCAPEDFALWGVVTEVIHEVE